MQFILGFILGVNSVILGWAFLMLYRNGKVYRYRRFLLEVIQERAYKDLYYGHDPDWRIREFDKVNYEQMLYQPWRKLDSFYPDKSFLK